MRKLRNRGLISPGNAPGIISVSGNYAQDHAASMLIELAGTTPDKFDAVNVSGTATLDGELKLSLLDGFVPSSADGFTFLTAGAVSGRFSNAIDSVRFDGGSFDISYGGGAVTLYNFSAVPEPAGAGLVASAGLLLLARRRARRGSDCR